MTLKGGSTQSCAACKYQRRKCNAECPLAPYFPPDNPKLFRNAHRLFGVKNILRILNHLDRDEKPEAMRSIIFQSNMRDMFPVHGCLEVIFFLRWRLQAVEEEYNLVLSQLELCRQHPIQELGMGATSNAMISFSATQNEANDSPMCFDFKDHLANPMWFRPRFGENDSNYVNDMENYSQNAAAGFGLTNAV